MGGGFGDIGDDQHPQQDAQEMEPYHSAVQSEMARANHNETRRYPMSSNRDRVAILNVHADTPHDLNQVMRRLENIVSSALRQLTRNTSSPRETLRSELHIEEAR